MDFIIDLLISNFYGLIFAIVDYFTEIIYFVSYLNIITNKERTKLFFGNINFYHGFISNNIFDYRTKFNSSLWKIVFNIL